MLKACYDNHNIPYTETIGDSYVTLRSPMVTNPDGTNQIVMRYNFVKSTGKLLSVKYEECE